MVLSTELVMTLSGVDRNHPYSDYDVLQNSLQQECAFVHRVTSDIGYVFRPVYKALRNSFMPDLFQGVGEGIPGQGVYHLPVKQAGLTLLDPTLTDPENKTVSCVITVHIIT